MTVPTENAHVESAPDRKVTFEQVPGDFGLPFLGQTLAFLKDPIALWQKRHDAYGMESRFQLIGQKGLLLLGPDANEFVMQDKPKVMSSFEAYDPFMGEIFPEVLGLMDFDEHGRHRRIMQAAFKANAMRGYMDILNQSIEQELAEWPVGQPFQLFGQVKTLLLDQAARLFMGVSVKGDVEHLNRLFIDAVKGISTVIRLKIPGTQFHRAVLAAREIQAYLQAHIAEKRVDDSKDLFGQLCKATSEDGEHFTDDQIVRHMLGLMSAAHETTTSAVTFMSYEIARDLAVQGRALDEINKISNESLSYENLAALPYIENCFYESLRLWGPSNTVPRKTVGACEFKGIQIPKGILVSVSPAFVHRMPEYWQDPARFDPDRFAEPRAEHKQHRYLFMPFGGGAHKCIGMHLAVMQVKALYFYLLRRYQLVLEREALSVKYTPIAEPADGLWVKLKPLK